MSPRGDEQLQRKGISKGGPVSRAGMTLRDCANIGQPNVVVTFKGPVSAFFHCGNSCVDTQEKLSAVVREQCVQLSVGGGGYAPETEAI